MTPEEAGKLNLESARDNGNRLAFPIESIGPFHTGLSKREYFAGLAMQGMLVNGGMTQGGSTIHSPGGISELAVMQADALLIELHNNKL